MKKFTAEEIANYDYTISYIKALFKMFHADQEVQKQFASLCNDLYAMYKQQSE